jgi:hypothetical protein
MNKKKKPAELLEFISLFFRGVYLLLALVLGLASVNTPLTTAWQSCKV